ncbi:MULTISPECIES: PAAR domain-containing protein [unclassified Pseudomonas]|uniref:PAAR domain-containing protein n=1 Tax=unclassified Pseudomonas TaxID=196821 RepID=UPI00075280A6|nr:MULTISPECIES: PAAR domain-containing protein [unclassified Pseudomonas]KVV12131.1 hypothetical protein AP060_00119 [Pseudomonas sp. TAD18]KVV12611.1 hypothetical protein AP059_00068 [Pseudomonas sp. TAA207]
MTAAAREGDSIEHSSALAGLLIGLTVGAAATVLIVGTGGLAAVAMIGAGAAAGAGIGQLIGSLSFCRNEAGKITSGSPNVFFNGKPAARAHLDHVDCDQHGVAKVLAEGSTSVYINGQPAARVDDRTECDGKISTGSGNIIIGGATQLTDAINPEVPVWLQWTIGGIGFASAVVLTGGFLIPTVAFFGGVAGGIGGHWVGGKLFGDGSNGQKLTAFGGAFLGGMLGAKGASSNKSLFGYKNTISRSTDARSAMNAQKLKTYYTQAERYGKGGTKELQNGRYRFYSTVTPSRNPGQMQGARFVREWDPSTGNKRSWYETIDHSGKVRSVAPKPVTDNMNHHIFNSTGKYQGRR